MFSAYFMSRNKRSKYIKMTSVAQHDCVLPSGLRARIFYPCEEQNSAPLAQWMPPSHGRFYDENLLGLAEYLQLPASRLLATVLRGLLRSRLSWKADAPTTRARLPLVLFSHGLGGSLAGNVSVCAALATTGRVVVAVEHGDGSAFAAYIGRERRRVPFAHSPPDSTTEQEMREIQLKQRVRELADAMRDMHALAGGKVPQQEPLALNGVRVDLHECIDPSTPVVVAGHSFGGGTALAFAFAAKRGDFNARVSHVICLDPWLTPLGLLLIESGDVGNARVLFVDQELTGATTSTRWRKSLKRPSGTGSYRSIRVLGGSHNNSTDFVTQLPMFIAVRAGLTAPESDPELLMETHNNAVISFLGPQWDAFWQDVIARRIDGLAPSFTP